MKRSSRRCFRGRSLDPRARPKRDREEAGEAEEGEGALALDEEEDEDDETITESATTRRMKKIVNNYLEGLYK